ncbi:putative ferric-chelate reductase 1-like protein, partial [Leptotrombidium deliense]
GPVESCETLLPRHAGTKASEKPSPYAFTATSDHYDNIDEYSSTKVEISGNAFAGFFVVAFDPHTGQNIGSWAKLEGTNILPCSGITHSNSKTKKLASLLWIPPHKKKGFVAFG